MASIKCKTLEACFYNGKLYKAGAPVSFLGNKKDLPKYLAEVKTVK